MWPCTRETVACYKMYCASRNQDLSLQQTRTKVRKYILGMQQESFKKNYHRWKREALKLQQNSSKILSSLLLECKEGPKQFPPTIIKGIIKHVIMCCPLLESKSTTSLPNITTGDEKKWSVRDGFNRDSPQCYKLPCPRLSVSIHS